LVRASFLMAQTLNDVQFFHCSCFYIMCSFQFSSWSKINPKTRWWCVISIATLLIHILILGVRPRTRFLLCMNIDFVFSADILNPFSLVYLMTLSAVFLSMASATLGSLCLVCIIQSFAYHNLEITILSFTEINSSINKRKFLDHPNIFYFKLL
jgi:hypothetical protein